MIYMSYIVTDFGIIEIRATSRKLLSVLFVDYENKNVTENEITRECAKELLEYFSGSRKKFDIQIPIEGTTFQKDVLNELLNIPYGEVVTYKDIAKRVGNEKAIRAASNIIGRNNLLVLIPCHRVIGSNGKMTGYVAGTKIKERLISLEKDNINN